MKIFAFILAVYILVLNAIPCIDVHKDTVLQKIELTVASSQNHLNILDSCSPFCTCDCCVSPVLYQQHINEFNQFSFVNDLISFYSSGYISSVYSSIWQPPQLS